MSKAYHHVRADMPTSVEVIAHVAANPTQYHLGSLITAANGDLCHVTAPGTAVVMAVAP